MAVAIACQGITTSRAGHGVFAASGKASIGHNGPLHAMVDGLVLSDQARAGSVADFVAGLARMHGVPGALERLDGEFAVAVLDERSGDLWLARDRMGVRPLYYWQDGDHIGFASRFGALIALPEVPRTLNRRWVATFAGSHYRYFDNCPDETPFVAIRQVPAGTVVHLIGGVAHDQRYWSLADRAEFAPDEDELAAQYRDLLLDAVRRRLRAVERPAFTLSGGMDSSSILALAAEATRLPQPAFSTVYADKTYDERAEIQEFVAEKAAEWHAIEVDGGGLLEAVRRMVRNHDEPVATATWLSHFKLCEVVAGLGFDSVFGGLGGDELNAGEYEYFVFHFADLARAGEHALLQREIAQWARYHDHPIYRKSAAVASALMDRLTDPAQPGRVRVDRARLTRYFATVSREFFDLTTFEPILDHPFATCLKNRTFQDLFRETTPCCLRAEDRNCEAFGLRQVDPFLDRRLVEFMFRVPGRLKIRDGVTKQLLRRAMRGILPEVTRTRIKKTGWNAPAHLWFSAGGFDQLRDLVNGRRFRERGVYDLARVRAVMDEHRTIVASGVARENHMMFLWQLLNLELWFQEVVERAPVEVTHS